MSAAGQVEAGPVHQPQESGVADFELVEQVRSGDLDAYLQLWERHVGPARDVASTADVSPGDAERAVNRAFSRVLGQITVNLDAFGPFRPYLFRMLHEEFGRRERGMLPVTNILRAFRRLPVRVQTVLWYSVVEGQDEPTVAVFTGTAPADLSVLLADSIEYLRAEWLVEIFCDPSISDTCAWLVQRADACVNGELGRISADRFARHLAGCPACTDFMGSLQAFPEVLRSAHLPLFTVADRPESGRDL